MTQNYDQPALALANRHPLLFQDLSEWVRAHPESTRLAALPGQAVSLCQEPHRLLCNAFQPSAVLRRLNEAPDAPLLHLFPEVAGFLHFLTQPSALDCIAHQSWLPLLLLPLPNAAHIQQWLLGQHPRDWPWALLNDRRFDDPATAQAVGTLARQMREFYGHLYARLAERLVPRYSDRPTPAEVLRNRQRPLRVLVLAFKGSAYQQFCARDIAEAFPASGIGARTLILSPGVAQGFELLESIESFDPDVLLLNGRDRSDFHGLPRRLCVLSWDQDYVLSCRPEYATGMGPRDLLMFMVSDWRQDAATRRISAGRTAYINIGANHHLYQPPTIPEPPQYDVLFVGNIHPFDTYRQLIKFDQLEPTAQQLMLHARQRLSDWIDAHGEDEPFVIPECDAFLQECLREMGLGHVGGGDHWRFLVHYFRYRIAHLLVREKYVSALTEFRLGLFGKGWEAFTELVPHAQPEIENGPPLREAIHRSAINLHLHTWTVHHPRLYDTAAAGGFLLVGRVPEEHPLERVFSAGQELDSFGSITELKRKIRHYLDHPDERQAMATAAAQRVRREHTMEHRTADMVRFLSEATYD